MLGPLAMLDRTCGPLPSGFSGCLGVGDTTRSVDPYGSRRASGRGVMTTLGRWLCRGGKGANVGAGECPFPGAGRRGGRHDTANGANSGELKARGSRWPGSSDYRRPRRAFSLTGFRTYRAPQAASDHARPVDATTSPPASASRENRLRPHRRASKRPSVHVKATKITMITS